MTKNQPNIIVTARLKFPLEIYLFTLFIIVVIYVVTKEIVVNDSYEHNERWLLILVISASLFFNIYIARRQYKRFIVYHGKFIIRPIYTFKSTVLYKEQLKGFELYETAIQGGLGYNIRLITSTGREIVFPKDSYENYDKILAGLHKSDLDFLGRKSFKEGTRVVYGNLLKWTAILFPIIYGLFLLIKFMGL